MRAPRPYVSEPVDPTETSPSGRFRAVKQAGLVLLAAAWVALGLAGHDPWKIEDAMTFGLAWDIAQRGDVVVPRLAGEDYVARPPLLPGIGALAIKALAPPLEPFDAARLVAGLALAAVLLFTALASRELAGRAFRWVPVLILIGTIGLWDRGHVASPEMGLTAGVALALYGLALALRRPVPGGVVLGIALAVAFLSRGLLGPAWLLVSMALLPAASSAWRTGAYAATAAIAIVVGAALAAPWPVALALRDPALVQAWLAAEAAPGYFALPGTAGSALTYFPRNLLWFAWPSLPLVAWMLWTRGRGFNGGLAQPGVQVPGVIALVMLVSLLLIPDPRVTYALPLLAPLAILASLEVDSLTRGFSAALDWFGILTFGLLAIVVWGIWIDARLYGDRRRAVPGHRDRLPAVVPPRCHRRRRVPHRAVDHAGAARAAQQPAHAAQLGGRRNARVVPLLDGVAAVSRLAPQLPARHRSLGGAPARPGLRGEPQPRRIAARAVVLFRRSHHDPRGDQSRPRVPRPPGAIRPPGRRAAGDSRLVRHVGRPAPR
jgi:4-amino-4-deoxy-L-arabinose transferase-like glycosyltransferase